MKVATFDEYIYLYPQPVQDLLQQLRKTIQQAAPLATETINYGIPAFKQQKILVYFAAYAHHIGFFPTASGVRAFENDLFLFKWSKGAIQSLLDQPLPLQLITQIVDFRVEEMMSTSPTQKLKSKKLVGSV